MSLENFHDTNKFLIFSRFHQLGEYVIPGNIIIRQRGSTYHVGENTMFGRDFTIMSLSEGYVKFSWNYKDKHQVVSVSPENPNPEKLQSTIERKIAFADAMAEVRRDKRTVDIREKNKRFGLELSF